MCKSVIVGFVAIFVLSNHRCYNFVRMHASWFNEWKVALSLQYIPVILSFVFVYVFKWIVFFNMVIYIYIYNHFIQFEIS